MWQGRPISSLETNHIERILSACRLGTWGSGKPCRVSPATERVLGLELAKRRRGPAVQTADQTPSGQDSPFAAPLPDYSAALDAMGYEPPPPPLPAPWSEPAARVAPLGKFTSVGVDPMDALRGTRLIEKLQEELAAATRRFDDAERAEARARRSSADLLDTRDRRIAQLQRELARERRAQTARKADVDERTERAAARSHATRERRAKAAKLDTIGEQDLTAWWRAEVGECDGVLADGLRRLLGMAARGVDMQQPRRIRRPGIVKDRE